MARVTKTILRSQLLTLNMMLERPLEQFASKIGEPTRFAIGHLSLQHDSSGYAIEETTSENGAVNILASGLTANEAYWILRGMVSGIGLRNRHIGELLLRNELVKLGLCNASHPLYMGDMADKGKVVTGADGSFSVVPA